MVVFDALIRLHLVRTDSIYSSIHPILLIPKCNNEMYPILRGGDGLYARAFCLGLQRKLTEGEVSLHNQKLALSSVIKELNDTKQTIDRFR